MKSESEEFCKESFDKYLRKTIPTHQLLWEDVDEKAEPPDFYLTVERTRYAVEVTQMIEKGDIGVKNLLPVRVIRDVLTRFVKEDVEAVAMSGGYLRGAYLVIFSKPMVNFADVKYQIQADLLSYISETQTASKAPSRRIYKAGRQECEIAKSHNRQDKVVMGGPIIGKHEGEILDKAKQLLDDRLTEKTHRLRNIGNSKILLLHDKYPFADRGTYRLCISKEGLLNNFHTVFVVGGNNKGEILYSKEPTWM
jgi:hypothetical protein